jgi:hypothetical protein
MPGNDLALFSFSHLPLKANVQKGDFKRVIPLNPHRFGRLITCEVSDQITMITVSRHHDSNIHILFVQSVRKIAVL